MDQYSTLEPSYSFIRYFLLKIIIVRPCTHTYTTNSVTGFLSLRSYYSSYRKHVHHVQSVGSTFLASSHRAPAFFSVLTTIRQSKPYTMTFFYSTLCCIAIFLQYPSFCSTFLFIIIIISSSSFAFRKAEYGDDIIWYMYLRDELQN